jgi:hypothetical protein
MRLRSFFLLPILAALAPAGCDLPLSPSVVVGTYVLASVNDAPLPALALENEWGTVIILADTLRLHSDRRGEGITIQREERHYQNGLEISTNKLQRTFGFILKDRRIEIHFSCPPNAICIAGPHLAGHPTAEGLELSSAYGKLVYRRR